MNCWATVKIQIKTLGLKNTVFIKTQFLLPNRILQSLDKLPHINYVFTMQPYRSHAINLTIFFLAATCSHYRNFKVRATFYFYKMYRKTACQTLDGPANHIINLYYILGPFRLQA